ncbi:MAG: antibiotic biosynthesis monooxygenase [Alphaproteobacteria bacterium]|nr:antibiotic biosynthesis monooxygenase [Alphaproteobacteria bacterium]
MYVVTVEFTIHAEHIDAFMPLMLGNASASRRLEPGCRQFDVCRDAARRGVVFLYEVYDDRAAFDAHLAAPHFKSFDLAVGSMVAAKRVQAWQRLYG